MRLGGDTIRLTPVTGPEAPGAPGIPPSWAPGRKQAVGTALSEMSPVWFTVAEGVLTEVYYPRVDTANTRDLQFLVTDGRGGFWEERRDTRASVETLDPRCLAWRVTTEELGGRFRIEKTILTDPQRPCVVVRARWRSAEGDRLFALFAPHVRDRGAGNSARLVRAGRQTLLTAWRHDTFVALAAGCAVPAASCGFVGRSDGWTDLRSGGGLTGRCATATGGNVALTAELAPGGEPFTLVLGFGRDAGEACRNALATLEEPYEAIESAYVAGWRAYCDALDAEPAARSADGGRQYLRSAMVLKAHEDKENPGAHIASLAVPWGEASGDANAGGYHLVWPRDLYHTATGKLAAGDARGACTTLAYLARTQRGDGTWPQNFWVYGEPYWRGLQLDEQAFPILLAWQLKRAGALKDNPYPGLVRDAAYAVARLGPVTQQERWEENSGYSPSTLASCIAGLCCAAEFARENGDPAAERYFLDVADCWSSQLEQWTYAGGSGPGGVPPHYERIAAELPDRDGRGGGGRREFLRLANLPAGEDGVDARAVVDGGFLELVRYGLRAPDDPRVAGSVAVYDAACRVETPRGPCWHRYTHDGYGQKDDGSPYDGTGRGRAWPLLTGERAHYELAAGRDAAELARALEGFAGEGGMIPEQVWDAAPIPERRLEPGGPTGSASPLVWAHAEYVKLLRSLRDGVPFDRPEPAYRRYVVEGRRSDLCIWKFGHRIPSAPAAGSLRFEVYAPAALHWTADGWSHERHDPFQPCGHGVWTFDLPRAAMAPGRTVEFTFYWHESGTWEGRNFSVALT